MGRAGCVENISLKCQHCFGFSQRYSRKDKRQKLPLWIQKYLVDKQCNLSIDDAVHVAKSFFREMAQPFSHVLGKTLLAAQHIAERESSLRKVFSSVFYVSVFVSYNKTYRSDREKKLAHF